MSVRSSDGGLHGRFPEETSERTAPGVCFQVQFECLVLKRRHGVQVGERSV
jgi:hypothetical protein